MVQNIPIKNESYSFELTVMAEKIIIKYIDNETVELQVENNVFRFEETFCDDWIKLDTEFKNFKISRTIKSTTGDSVTIQRNVIVFTNSTTVSKIEYNECDYIFDAIASILTKERPLDFVIDYPDECFRY
jgi:hypothetical protein